MGAFTVRPSGSVPVAGRFEPSTFGVVTDRQIYHVFKGVSRIRKPTRDAEDARVRSASAGRPGTDAADELSKRGVRRARPRLQAIVRIEERLVRGPQGLVVELRGLIEITGNKERRNLQLPRQFGPRQTLGSEATGPCGESRCAGRALPQLPPDCLRVPQGGAERPGHRPHCVAPRHR